ncbi:Acetyltransferase (GNAT) family protein [Pelagirhabdus alkalitolerans]|uniref:Acetyltransferase (GNAT) family protein n=1 Tax=Pelagirhabdus alkalitolerans TaxID=1612202 RepID=A0A1G6LH12_9BACI|nr:GNAT family N-acetyltransferase [Pelagirhabdus alkalitolerans]SDC42463.1 Acetyltransferase (GNAT) family protein [Pelagirhabdus alkalitolerans]
MAHVYLLSTFCEYTFSQVALADGVPVGVMLGKNNKQHKKPLKQTIRYYWAVAKMLMRKESRGVLNLFAEIDRENEELLESLERSFDAELVLFAVSRDQHGQGIGNALYQAFLDQLKQEQLDTFYLYTDTTCTYTFYDRQNLHRLAEKTMTLPLFDEQLTLYIYSNTP